MDSDLEPRMLDVIKTVEAEDKWRLEGTYGVEIDPECLPLCCRIITSSYDFTEASDHEKERLLKRYMVTLLDAVCHRFVCHLHKVAEEDGLDIEYLLHRTCTELAELEKEKSRHELWITQVRKEYEELMGKWHKFEETWKPLLMSQRIIGVEELGMLRLVREEVLLHLQNGNSIEKADIVSKMFKQLGALGIKVELLVDKDLKRLLTIGRTEIEEATREFLCIPASWPSKFLKPDYQNLETRLFKRFIGQGHVIHVISSALRRPHSGKGPIRSFLFLCGDTSNGEEEELAKALAEEVFYDKERLIEFDLSKLNVKGELVDAVKKKPYSVIFLQNIDKAHASVTDFLLQILRDGKIADEKARTVDFSKTLIIMKSCVLDYEFRHWTCDCAYKAEKLPLEESVDHDCKYLSLLKHAKQYLNPELFGIIDNVIVFIHQAYQHYKTFARIQLRSLTSYMGGGRLILYPSEAALNLIVREGGLDFVSIKSWLEENVAPKLLDIREGARMVRSIIYLDALVGIEELSYRVEMGGCLAGNYKESEQFLANLWKVRDLYEKELSRLRAVNGLRTTLQMLDGIVNTNVSVDLQLLADRIGNLLIDETAERSTVLWNLQVASACNKFAKLWQKEGPKRADKKEMEALRTKLSTSLVVGHYVFDTVTRALLSYIDCCIRLQVMANRCAAFLLLGLTTAGKEDLLEDLTKLLAGENGTNLLRQINSSECTDFDKFFNLIYANHKPCSVLLIDKVEMAPTSVFSGLLWALDRGMLSDHRGCTVDLRHTAVILVSDLGNRDCISQMFKEASERELRSGPMVKPSYSSWQEYRKQPERKRFRSELLNLVEEIVFFNPTVPDGKQLTNFVRLSMRGGPHMDPAPPPCGLIDYLQQIFDEGDHKREPYIAFKVASTMNWLARGIISTSKKKASGKIERVKNVSSSFQR